MSTVLANPVLSEIRELHQKKQSGILVLTGGAGERVEVFFREGMIDAASSNMDARRLGDYLAKQEYLHARDLDAAHSEAQRHQILIGEAVVRKRLLGQAEVIVAVRQQATEVLEHVFKNNFAVDSFRNSLKSYYAPARIAYPQVLLEVCRSKNEPFECKEGTRIVLSNGTDLSVFPWYPEELSLLSEIKVPSTVQELAKTTGMKETSIRKVLGVFQTLGIIETFADAEAPIPGALTRRDALVRTSEFPLEELVPVVSNATLAEKLQIARSEMSFTSEQFKNLKVQLRDAASKASLKVLTVSSPDPRDGKSLISSALAFSFSMDPGRRVIIVDCDLRNPSLDGYLGVTPEPGLLQYLASTNMSPYCYVRRIESLYFLTVGGVATNSIEILSLRKMKELIESLRKDFDTIILDAPPFAPIADARIVTGLSDGLIMVLRRGKTSYADTDRAFQAIDRNKLLGVVFNDVQRLFKTYSHYGQYYYGPPADAKKVKGPKSKNYLQS